MADMPTQARVVIIGGGVVGVSALYHLCKAGWTDCVLLEKNELTAGSTWHAAGNVPTFSTSWSIMNMQRYSTELYRGLGEAVDYAMNYHVTGSIRLGHSEERMQEFERARGMGLYQGMNLEILAPDEIRDKYPFIETHDLKGALYDPADGDIDPAQLTQALAKGARDMGATILRFCPATGVSRENGEWIVHTEKGDIRCEIVVNAAGYYAQRVGEWFKPFGGRTVPMMVMSHQYLIFDEVPAVRDWSARRWVTSCRSCATWTSPTTCGRRRTASTSAPTNGTARRIGPTRPIRCPRISASSFTPTRWTGWNVQIEDSMARVPVLAEAGLAKTINGPIPYAPDGNPLLGPMPGVPNAFEACVFTFGIAQGGGAGKVLAEWITEGRDRMGHVVLRSAPLHRLHRPRLLRRQGDGGLRPRIRNAFPVAPLARRAGPQGLPGP
jgi:dimethylglycine dehydrogenase